MKHDIMPWFFTLVLVGIFFNVFMYIVTIGSQDELKIELAKKLLSGIPMLMVYVACAFLAVRTKGLWYWVPLIASIAIVKFIGATSLITLLVPNAAATLMINFIGLLAVGRCIETIQLRNYDFDDITVGLGPVIMYGIIAITCLFFGSAFIAAYILN